MVIALAQSPWRAPARRRLTRCGAAPPPRRHPLTQTQLAPRHNRRVGLPAAGGQDLRPRGLRADDDAGLPLDHALPPPAFADLRVEPPGPWHAPRRGGRPCVLAPRRLSPGATGRHEGGPGSGGAGAHQARPPARRPQRRALVPHGLGPGPRALPPGPRRRRVRWGARAVHTPGGERERRTTASASLPAPARPARRPAERASSGLGLLCPARRTEAEKAWRGSGPSPSQGRSVGGAISQPRAVPRLPRPAATHAIPRPLRSGAARLPGQRGPGGAATSPWHAPPGRCRQAFPPGGPVARLVPRPRPPREAHPGAGQQCVGVSPGRWRPRGPGRPGGGDPGAVARAAAPCAQAAHSG